ncbi:butyrophilin subfamily 3 member A2-like isoform X10 [Siniperca chuatsi]|uniref:butyrophilin subfamily 3 member A2-like isoform X10 n=1 Tax=Siniperca chuatsi TaxID=119488 RepID=UPI001CE0CEDE|nr:butyrophilin subfamily 3 member A2-like isoform X10 [Siniperca chuatsi]
MKWKTELILIGLVLLLINANTDNGQLICPKSRVEAAVGEDVTLECHVDPERDVTLELFKLKFNQADSVLVYGDGKVFSDDQAEQFKGRVSLESNSENLSKGEFVVKISPLNTTDAGTYTCTFRIGSQKISCSIDLIIDPKENRSPGNPTDSGGGDHNTYVTGSGSVIVIVIHCHYHCHCRCCGVVAT